MHGALPWFRSVVAAISLCVVTTARSDGCRLKRVGDAVRVLYRRGVGEGLLVGPLILDHVVS